MSMTAAPLMPRSPDGVLNVVAIGRISTVNQDVENIAASYRYVQDFLGRLYQGPLKITLLGEQASGMRTDRATIREAEALVAGGAVDLIIAEDMARIYRNPRHQYAFIQNAVDVGTRVICVGDNLDTADEDWEITMGAAALRHGLHIPDTRRRVRRKATHTFHQGGMVQKIRYGYRKLTREEAAEGRFGPVGLRIAKLPECTAIIREMVERVLRGDKFAAVAEWLDAEGIMPGHYVTSRRWTARLVADLLHDPILAGTRTFRDTICRPIFKTGRHKSTRNPEPEVEHYPDIAHLGVDEYEALRRELARRKSEHTTARDGPWKRQGVPRSRSLWPGQAATCAICGGPMYYAGPHLKCSRAQGRLAARCWNHVQVPAKLTRERAIAWLVARVEPDDRIRQAVVETIWKLVDQASNAPRRRQHALEREIEGLERQTANLVTAIAEGGQMQVLVAKLKAVEIALRNAQASKAAEAERLRTTDEPQSKERVCAALYETLLGLASSSFEFADFLRQIFPTFAIQPVQTLDSGQIRPRAKIVFRPSAICAAVGAQRSELASMLDEPIAFDLFEPPLHLRHFSACLSSKEASPRSSLKMIARSLEINHMTVKRAFDYARFMARAGLAEFYREVHEQPVAASRWRHRTSTTRC